MNIIQFHKLDIRLEIQLLQQRIQISIYKTLDKNSTLLYSQYYQLPELHQHLPFIF